MIHFLERCVNPLAVLLLLAVLFGLEKSVPLSPTVSRILWVILAVFAVIAWLFLVANS